MYANINSHLQIIHNPSLFLIFIHFFFCLKLCERDSHGCTPFLTAIMMHNLRGADLILEAVKRDGKNESKHPTPVGKPYLN